MKRWMLAVVIAVAMAEALFADPADGCDAWERRVVGGPSSRTHHAMAYDSAHGVLMLFGGQGPGVQYLGDTWTWDGVQWLEQPGQGPSPRARHDMVYDSARGVIVLFGGSAGGSGYSPETWEWDPEKHWTLRTTAGPERRRSHAMAYDSRRKVTVLFGGTGERIGFLDDTWEWDGATWTERTVPHPPTKSGHRMAFDSRRGVVVLVGGIGDHETWEYDGSAWALASSGAPSADWGHALAFDAARGLTFQRSGYDTHAWDGSAWTGWNVHVPGSVPGFAYMCSDSRRHVLVLFGGTETYELTGGRPPEIVVHPSTITTHENACAEFSVLARNGQPLEYQWRRDGLDLPGATHDRFLIENATPGDEGSYDVRVSNACFSVLSAPADLTVLPALPPPPCPGDYDGDGDVDKSDLGTLLSNYGCECTGDCYGDADGDGRTDQADLGALLARYGGRCP